MAYLWKGLSLAGMVFLFYAWSAVTSRLYWSAIFGVLVAVGLFALSAKYLPEEDR